MPAALVPKLRDGDGVEVRFTGYSPPATKVRYHANVAFITSSAPERWYFPRSGPLSDLFAAHAATIRFTYGTGEAQGTPIFFIVPEDKSTRGMDGVRDYVGAHPTDFKTMTDSANEAVDRYTWYHDFLSAFDAGAIPILGGQQRIAAVAASLGADPTAVNTCYTEYTAADQIQSCVSGQLNALAYQTNFTAPTEGQFFGGILGAATPTQFASYLAPLLTVWQLFIAHGHQEYEYLPTTLTLGDSRNPSAASVQVLAGEKVPTLRPPAAQSSVVFFSIGEQNGPQPPRVVNDASAPAMCARQPRLELPLHLNQTSRYLSRTALIVTTTAGTTRRIPIDPDDVDAPILDRSAIDDGHDIGYRVTLAARYGFDPVAQPVQSSLYVAVPRAATWQIAEAPHRAVEAGGALDLVAAGPAAPCVSSAELQVGGTRVLPVQTTLVDPTHIALHAALAGVPPGDAVLRLYQSDPGSGHSVESDEAVAIGPPPAHISDEAPLVHVGDTAMALSGSGFDRIRALRIGDDTLVKASADSNAGEACFTGNPLALHAQPGAELAATLVRNDGSTGEAFAVRVAAPRPSIASVTTTSGAATHFSTDILRVVVKSDNPLPPDPVVLVGRAPTRSQPCEGAGTFAAVSADRVHVLDTTSLEAFVQADSLLHDQAFGTLQVALSDPHAQATSDWAVLPGTFVRAPLVSDIDCSAPAATTCRLVGSDLLTIAGVVLPGGSVQTPDLRCTPADKEPGCVTVPRLAHYHLVLTDGSTPYDVPDALIK